MPRDSARLRARVLVTGVLVATVAALAPSGALAGSLGPWSPAVSLESLPGSSSEVNTPSADGCPIQSPDGLRLYMATNRPGGLGGLDIWVASRPSTAVGFGTPVNLGAPINSAADDFCPTPVRGKGLFFVSARAIDGACGGADIYFARDNPAQGWTAPVNLGCQVNGAGGEAGPSYFEADGRAWLYFSSGPELMASERQPDGSFGTATAVAELNSPDGDFRPNVRKGGLEIVFDSNRAGGFGGQDLYLATRLGRRPVGRPRQRGFEREHRRRRVAGLLQLGRQDAPVRPRPGARGLQRHLRHDPGMRRATPCDRPHA